MPNKPPKNYVNPFSSRSKEQYDFAHKLRREPTTSEAKLWQKLRANQLGVKFRRQHLIGQYIVDFYCNELKLIIEIDGDVHAEDGAIERDQRREQWLLEHGYKIIRFTNSDVLENDPGLLDHLSHEIGMLKKEMHSSVL
jgi:very-short-patch-repair endonuclease